MRRISTGGSISANNTGASDYSSRRKSLKQILTGSRRSSDEKLKPVTSEETAEKEKLIQNECRHYLLRANHNKFTKLHWAMDDSLIRMWWTILIQSMSLLTRKSHQ